MAVPAGPTEKRYTGNGVTKIFTIPFLLLAAGDLDVFIDGVEVSSGFTITDVGNPTSVITFTSAPANLSDILLQLNVPFERLNDYQENGDFLAVTVNRDFDRIWQALKQVLRLTTRALSLGFFDVDGSGMYRAKGNRIIDLADPVNPQDAATLGWVGRFIDSVSGAINTTVGIAYDTGTLFDYLKYGVSRKVDTVAALRALDITRNQRAMPLGYYAKGDGGGGPSRYAVTGQPPGTFVDNGGSVILPTGGDGSAAWVWSHSGSINIEWFGATTAPLVDNTPFILNAVQNGSTVKIPRRKIYSVSGVEIIEKNNFTITGGGQLRLLDLSNKPVLRATRCTGFQFDGVKIDGNKAGQNNTSDRNLGSCLFAYMCTDWKIIYCETINGYSGACILAIDNSGNPAEVQTNGIIGWNTIKDGGGATTVTLCDGIFANSDNTLIIGNTIYNVSDYGIAADYSRNLKIAHNSVRKVGYCGIGILGAFDWDVSNNRVQQAGLGIAVTLSGNAAISPFISHDVRISGNIISDITNAGGLLGDAVFVDPSATDIEVTLNKVRNVFRGIACSSPNSVVALNTVRDTVDRGIFVDGAGSLISGNKTVRCAAGNYYGTTLADKTIIEDSPTNGVSATPLLNGWLNYGAPYLTAGYSRQSGRTTLRGVLKSGLTGGSPMYVLPVGYRPIEPIRFSVPGDAVGGVANILIDTSGNVIHVSGAVAEVHLANISFVIA